MFHGPHTESYRDWGNMLYVWASFRRLSFCAETVISIRVIVLRILGLLGLVGLGLELRV